MVKIIKKTSFDWYFELNEQEKKDGKGLTVILDPDGWDRKNYKYSFDEELVTLEEFNIRLNRSTCLFYPSKKSIK